MKNCPECKGPLASNALSCPSCGYVTWWGRLQPMTRVSWWIGTLFLLFLAWCSTVAQRN
jgi:hypothetical protein